MNTHQAHSWSSSVEAMREACQAANGWGWVIESSNHAVLWSLALGVHRLTVQAVREETMRLRRARVQLERVDLNLNSQ